MNEIKVIKTEDGIYVLSNDYLNEEQVFNQLDAGDQQVAEFIEYDKAVASHYGYKNCAIFHILNVEYVEYKLRYVIRDRETGSVTEDFATYKEAKETLEEYEEADKKEGIYKEDFYEIYDTEKEEEAEEE